MSESLTTIAYLGATILFILSLGGLSNPETARRGNMYGMIGMAIAVLATVFGPHVTSAGISWIIVAMVNSIAHNAGGKTFALKRLVRRMKSSAAGALATRSLTCLPVPMK